MNLKERFQAHLTLEETGLKREHRMAQKRYAREKRIRLFLEFVDFPDCRSNKVPIRKR